jgi:hypothetical protein
MRRRQRKVRKEARNGNNQLKLPMNKLHRIMNKSRPSLHLPKNPWPLNPNLPNECDYNY